MKLQTIGFILIAIAAFLTFKNLYEVDPTMNDSYMIYLWLVRIIAIIALILVVFGDYFQED